MCTTKTMQASPEAVKLIEALGNFIYYTHSPSQLLIDFVDDKIDHLKDEYYTKSDVVSLGYHLGNIREVYSPKLKNDIDVIDRIDACLTALLKSPSITHKTELAELPAAPQE